MRNEQQCLDGSELWNSLRWFYDREHGFSMTEFDPLNGALITFVRGKARVNLKEALTNLETDGKNPKKLSYLIYGQFIWSDRTPIQIHDLEMSLWFDEQCTKHPVNFVTFQFPKKPIQNGASFALKVSITKNVEFHMWNHINQPFLELTQAAKPIMEHPDWESWFKQLPKQTQETFHKFHLFYVKICGQAKEGS